jgi:hypothetical protein
VAELPEVVQPAIVDESPTLPPEPTETPAVATTLEAPVVEPITPGLVATTHDPEPTATELPLAEKSATIEGSAPKNPRKLKVKADLKLKKLSMIMAALQGLQDRKVAMTCPELIDVMATEDLWTSPGGKTPAATLYAALSRSIKDEVKASAFRKAERGKFEAKILPKISFQVPEHKQRRPQTRGRW